MSADLGHDRRSLLPVQLGIDLRHGRRAVAEDDAGHVQAELLPQAGRGGVAQLVRVPGRDARLPAAVPDRMMVRLDGVALAQRAASDSASGARARCEGYNGVVRLRRCSARNSAIASAGLNRYSVAVRPEPGPEDLLGAGAEVDLPFAAVVLGLVAGGV